MEVPWLGRVDYIQDTVYCLFFPSVSQIFLSLICKQKFLVCSSVFGFVSHLFFQVKALTGYCESHIAPADQMTLAYETMAHSTLGIVYNANGVDVASFSQDLLFFSGVKRQTVMS